MVYKKNFVVCVKVNGKILREAKDVVTLPFGSEYSILLKNMNAVRATAKVEIDGVDVLGGVKLELDANGSVELERSITNRNFEKGNRFKFIERTEAVEAGRGIGSTDGLVRVEFAAEIVQPAPIVQKIIQDWQDWRWWPGRQYQPYDPYDPYYPPYQNGISCKTPLRGCQITAQGMSGSLAMSAESMNKCSNTESINCVETSINDIGVTVPGSLSNQKFSNGFYFATDTPEVITLRLLGKKAGKTVVKPVSVSDKPVCITCKKANRPSSKFCSECGTSLEIV